MSEEVKRVTKNAKRRIKAKADRLNNMPLNRMRMMTAKTEDLSIDKGKQIVAMMSASYSERFGDKIEYKNIIHQRLFWIELGCTPISCDADVDASKSDGKVVSAAVLTLDYDWKDAEWSEYKVEMPSTVGFVSVVTTDKHHRGMGYSTRVMQSVIDWVKANVPIETSDNRKLYLEVTEDNPQARAVYRKVGFKQVGSRPVGKYQYNLLTLAV